MFNNVSKNTTAFAIFIADDNEINRLLLKSQLQPHCKNITFANDGEQALSYLQQNKYHLIFLDLRMPHYSGEDILKHIKQTNSINKDSPVIAITAHTQSHKRQTLIEAGFDECLIKPILLEQIAEILNLWIPKENSYRQNETDVIDYVSALLEKTRGNTELATTIFNKLFAELQQQLQTIELALSSNDLSLAEQVTHKLHGSVSFCGFTDFQEIARKMELSLSENNFHYIDSNFLALKNKTINFITLKEQILSQLSLR
ncbi:MAG: response regulator [Methylococcaceae bacterium]